MKVGIGGCEATLETLEWAYEHCDKPLLIDSGYGYQGTQVFDRRLGEFLKGKPREDFIICNKLPLFEKLYIESFGKPTYEMTDEELEFAIRKVLEQQMKNNGVEYYDFYLYHAVFDDRFSSDFSMVKETERDKRIGKVLAKLKTEGLIKKIGFSAHLKYEMLYYWVEEMEKAFGPEFLQVAMVSFNILNDSKDNWLAKFYRITVWDAAGKEGIDYLKSKNMTLINMMPTESGRIGQVSMNQDWFNWAHRYIRDYSNMDYVLLGSHYIKHLEPAVKIYKKKDLEELPDMRIINAAKPGHCHGE